MLSNFHGVRPMGLAQGLPSSGGRPSLGALPTSAPAAASDGEQEREQQLHGNARTAGRQPRLIDSHTHRTSNGYRNRCCSSRASQWANLWWRNVGDAQLHAVGVQDIGDRNVTPEDSQDRQQRPDAVGDGAVSRSRADISARPVSKGVARVCSEGMALMSQNTPGGHAGPEIAYSGTNASIRGTNLRCSVPVSCARASAVNAWMTVSAPGCWYQHVAGGDQLVVVPQTRSLSRESHTHPDTHIAQEQERVHERHNFQQPDNFPPARSRVAVSVCRRGAGSDSGRCPGRRCARHFGSL